MIILKDIQDASTMQKVLNRFVRRSNTFNYSKEHMLVELDMIITDLCVFEVLPDGEGLRLVELHAGVSLEDVIAKTGCQFSM